VDHGKTALVGALTGVDTDRLPEERARGISIALGYAPLDLPSGRRLSVVDVPGHERFVRTMVAGATGIDLFLMVVAADDGVMPQTREHAAVLAALGVENGVVAVTKTDLADPARATAEAAELLPGVPAVAVGVRSGAGLDDLRGALDDAASRVLRDRSAAAGPTRLHADRVFSVRGVGTVVTGTLWSGSIGRGDELTVLPRGHSVRVRGVQVHDAGVERAQAGQRVAVNVNASRNEVARGDVLVAGDGTPAPTYRIDAALDWRPSAGRIVVHHGTRESAARAVDLGDGTWQLRLDAPLVPSAGDRVVVRSMAPPDTLGGGVVLDPHPRRRSSAGPEPEPGPETAPEPVSTPVAASPAPLPSSALAAAAILRDAGHEPPLDAELGSSPAEFAALREHGLAVRLTTTMHVDPEALAGVEGRLRVLFETREELTLADLRDDLKTSRKYAQAFLEYFDAARVTLRVGDARRLRGRRSGQP